MYAGTQACTHACKHPNTHTFHIHPSTSHTTKSPKPVRNNHLFFISALTLFVTRPQDKPTMNIIPMATSKMEMK